MNGYVPVFGSIFQGTLCGRWPDTGVWLCLLALADKNGHIDMTVPFISAVTGVPVDVLTECIARFSSPDPLSRTQTDDGRRLSPLDPTRNWGWIVINHGKYREKARLMAKAQAEKDTGKNAERMKDRRRPPETASDPLSDADADADTNRRNGEKKRAPVNGSSERSRRVPQTFVPDLRYAEVEIPDIDAKAEAARFMDFEFKTPRSDWSATWRNWIRTCKETKRYARRGSTVWQ